MKASGGGGGSGHAASTYRTLRTHRSIGTLSEINVTPLVDVVLVLLLVFMVTAPMMSRGIDVTLPVADQPDNSPEDRLTVSVRADARVFVGDQPVNLALLEQYLRDRLSGSPSKIAYLRADEKLQYGKVIEVVDKMKRAGVEQIGFVYVLPEDAQ